MPIRGTSLLSVEDLNTKDLETIFSNAEFLKARFKSHGRIDDCVLGESKHQKTVTMIFAEPSTRTRLSFEMACARIGVKSLSLEDLSTSSVVKGETLEDTFHNVVAMQPDALVVRYGNDLAVDRILRDLGSPVISGGIGTIEHPTQALLDAVTIRQHFNKKIEGRKVLLVGDVLHSRVANSNVRLLKKLGAKVGYCTPEEFAPTDPVWNGTEKFTQLKEGFQWADAVMGLRMQKERHQSDMAMAMSNYREQFRISEEHMRLLQPNGLVLHPGPVMVGVDFTPDALKDSRCKILDQVTNGVYVRAAVIAEVLGLKVRTE